jgi:hypothetical protein
MLLNVELLEESTTPIPHSMQAQSTLTYNLKLLLKKFALSKHLKYGLKNSKDQWAEVQPMVERLRKELMGESPLPMMVDAGNMKMALSTWKRVSAP